jgi:hypothetical protein
VIKASGHKEREKVLGYKFAESDRRVIARSKYDLGAVGHYARPLDCDIAKKEFVSLRLFPALYGEQMIRLPQSTDEESTSPVQRGMVAGGS